MQQYVLLGLLLLANAAQGASIRGTGSLLGLGIRPDCRPQQVNLRICLLQHRARIRQPESRQRGWLSSHPACTPSHHMHGLRRCSCLSAATPPRSTSAGGQQAQGLQAPTHSSQQALP